MKSLLSVSVLSVVVVFAQGCKSGGGSNGSLAAPHPVATTPGPTPAPLTPEMPTPLPDFRNHSDDVDGQSPSDGGRRNKYKYKEKSKKDHSQDDQDEDQRTSNRGSSNQRGRHVDKKIADLDSSSDEVVGKAIGSLVENAETSTHTLLEVYADKSQPEKRRVAAGVALEEIGGERAVKVMEAVLWDSTDNQAVRYRAAFNLGGMKDPTIVPALIKTLASEKDQVVMQAIIDALGEQRDESALDLLIKMLPQYKGNFVSQSLINALGKIGGYRVVPYLEDALSDKSGFYLTRQYAALWLGQLGQTQDIALLTSVANDASEEPALRNICNKAIQTLNNPSQSSRPKSSRKHVSQKASAKPDSKSETKKESPKKREQSLGKKPSMPAQNTVPKTEATKPADLSNKNAEKTPAAPAKTQKSAPTAKKGSFNLDQRISDLDSASDEVVGAAIDSLIKNPKSSEGRLLEILGDRSQPAKRRMNASVALEAIGGKSAVSVMAAVLWDRSDAQAVRFRAAFNLGSMNDSSIVPSLIKTAESETDVQVLQAVIDALGDQKNSEATGVLLTLLPANRGHFISQSIINSLGKIGSLKGVPAIEETLSDRGSFYLARQYAAAALGKLHQTQAIPALTSIANDPQEDQALRNTCAKAILVMNYKTNQTKKSVAQATHK